MTQADKDELLIRVDSRTRDIHEWMTGKDGAARRLTVVETQQHTCPARRRNWMGIVVIMVGLLEVGVMIYLGFTAK
jgi:hypothetical protein